MWFPWGSIPMGTTVVSRQGDTLATPWPDRVTTRSTRQGHGIAFQGLARTEVRSILAGCKIAGFCVGMKPLRGSTPAPGVVAGTLSLPY